MILGDPNLSRAETRSLAEPYEDDCERCVEAGCVDGIICADDKTPCK